MTLLYSVAQIRAAEDAHGSAGLMEKAGLAVATLAKDLLADGACSILIIAGPGNNGGDALVAARYLKGWWYRVSVTFAGVREKLPPDAADAFDAWLAAGGLVQSGIAQEKYGLVIDGLFGIGLSRDLQGRYAELVAQINALDVPVLALDIPSGLCADTGRVLGMAVRATHTLTFLGLKPGLYTLEGPDHTGTVHFSDLGVQAPMQEISNGFLVDTPPALPAQRRHNSHKGGYGSVGVLGGDNSMVGAALLAARAALLTGAGRVYAGLLAENAPAVDFGQPELMLRAPAALFDLDHLTALAVGPGLGCSANAEALLLLAVHYPAPLLLDADALNMLARKPELIRLLRKREACSILTPHPGEAARLLDCSTADIQADRVASALKLARDFAAIVVLKGCGTVIATPDGRWFINASGNAGLASAGMGDILCGIIVSLIGQGMAIEKAVLLGVHLHGAAADGLTANGVGPAGMTASEVCLVARDLLNRWVYGDQSCKPG